VVTLAYTEVPYITQDTATRYRNCTEGYYNWVGTAFTVPLYDGFVDTRIPPQPPVSPPEAPVPPRPEPENDGGQIYVAPPAPTFPRPQYGNMVWFAEYDSAIFIPGDFVNGTLVYNSSGGYYNAIDPIPTNGGVVIDVPNPGYTNIVCTFPTGNTDPVIPPMPVTIDVPEPPPVEESPFVENFDSTYDMINQEWTTIDYGPWGIGGTYQYGAGGGI
jgi:hypothetical protein